jgi:hypothetical protein
MITRYQWGNQTDRQQYDYKIPKGNQKPSNEEGQTKI